MKTHDITSFVIWEAVRLALAGEAWVDQERYKAPCPVCRLSGCERHKQERKL